MNSRTAKAAHPRLQVVQEKMLELGELSEGYKRLNHQQAIDLANALSVGDVPEWAQGEAVLELTTISGATLEATLEAVGPDLTPEPVILRSAAPEDPEGIITLVVAEGLANGLTVAAFSPTTSVCCIPKPALLEEAHAEALSALVNGARVILVMDESPELNEDAHNRAEALSAAITKHGASEVTVLAAQKSLQAVLDIAPHPEEALKRLLENTRPIQQIRSAAKTMGLSYVPYVSTLLGQVVEAEPEQYDEHGVRTTPPTWRYAGHFEGEKVYARSVLMTAAPVIESITTKVDVLDPKYEQQKVYGLAVQIGPRESCKIYHIEVREAELERPMQWRAKLPAGSPEILFGPKGRGTTGGQAIGEGIRQTKANAELTERLCIQTVMWYKDHHNTPRWVDAKGAHGPHDKTPLLYQDVRPQVWIPSPDDYTPDQIEDSIDDLLFNTAPKYIDPTAWYAGVCAVFHSLAGGHPHGVLWYVGASEAGKSYITGMLASIVSPEYGPKNVMGVPDGTLAALRGMVEEISNAPAIVDDYRPRASRGRQDIQEDSTDQLIRAGYTGGSAWPGKKEIGPDKKTWITRTPRNTHPFIIVAGESLPSEENASGINRLLVIDVGPETLKDGGRKYLDSIHERHGYQPAAAAFLRWRASVIQNDFGSDIEAARIALEKRGEDLAEPYLEQLRGDLKRLKEVATGPLTGAAVIRDFLVGTGRLTEEDGDTWYRYWAKLIAKAARKHGETRLSKNGLADQLIRAIQDRITARKIALAPWDDDEHRTLIGQVVTINGEGFGGQEGGRSCIALIPSEVKEIAGSIGIKNPGQVLAPYLLKEGGRLTRPVRIKGHRAWAYVINPERWDPYGKDEEDADSDA